MEVNLQEQVAIVFLQVAHKNEKQGPSYCTWTDHVRDGNACDADAKARHLATAANELTYDTEAMLQNAFRNATT